MKGAYEMLVANQPQPKIGRFKRSLELTKSAWRILKLDKKLVLLPVIGFALFLATLLVAAAGSFGLFQLIPKGSGSGLGALSMLLIVCLFLAALLAPIVISVLISGAIVHAALERFEGRTPTLKGSLQAARQKLGSLFKFGLLSATVGLLLSVISDRLPVIGGTILQMAGSLAWSIASLFSIPYIMTSDKPLGPIVATKQSSALIKKIWGESLMVSGGVGVIAMLSGLAYLAITIPITVLLGTKLGAGAEMGLGIGTAVGLIALSIPLNVLASIAKTAVFYWATTGEAPEMFNKELLHSALKPKKARKIFV